MLRTYWLRLLITSLVFAGISYFQAMKGAKKYEATAQIMIDQQQMASSFASTPQERSTQDLLAFARPRSIETQVEQLTSFGVLEEAGADAAAKLGKPTPDPDSDFFATNLFTKIFVDAQPGSDIITLKVYMDSPESSRVVAQSIYDAFSRMNQKNAERLGAAAADTLQSQLQPIKNHLAEIEQGLEKLRTSANTLDLPTQVVADVQSRSNLASVRDQASMEYASWTARLAALKAFKAIVPAQISSYEVSTPNPLLQQAMSQVQAAIAERSQMLETFNDDAPQVQEVDRKIKSLQDSAKALAKTIVASRNTQPNPTYQNLVSQITDAEASAAAAKSKLEAADTALEARSVKNGEIPRQLSENDRLNREKLAYESQYQTLSQQLGTLATSKVGRSSPSQLVTPPFAKPDPISPRPMGNAATGAVAGALLALISMFLVESKRQPIRTIAQMNSLAFEPVFRVIPELDATRRGFTPRIHESFETLLLNFLHSTNRPYSIGVVGITPGAGATHASASLATAAIRHGYSVAVVDRDPKQSMKKLAERGQKLVAQAGARLTFRSLTTDGPVQPETELAQAPDLVIHDFAPAVSSAEYALEAGKLDEVVVLVRAGATKSVDFMQVQQALKDAGCRHITLVFTRSRDFTVVTETMERPIVTDFA
jgi:uncharacterized protein involved in exopolysaccharide biosynthesis